MIGLTVGSGSAGACLMKWAIIRRAIEGDSDLLGMATGEGVAHLNHLIARGETVRERGADGVYHYRMK